MDRVVHTGWSIYSSELQDSITTRPIVMSTFTASAFTVIYCQVRRLLAAIRGASTINRIVGGLILPVVTVSQHFAP